MQIRRLGNSGLEVSVVGLGCNNFGGRLGKEGTAAVIDKAIDCGITLFDTADAYGEDSGSERLLGELLGARRHKIVLATKFGLDTKNMGVVKSASRQYIMQAVEASLRRLKTDYIDLYQQHRFDSKTPIEETLRALDDLVRQGKVRYIGCSNFAAWQMVDAQWTARDRNLNHFVSCQDEYSLMVRGIERELVPAAQAYGMGILPYFPLASGLLTGKYRGNQEGAEGSRLSGTGRLRDRFMTDANLAKVDRLAAFAAEHGHTMLELAFSWLAQRPCVSSVIAGATRPEQIEQNVAAAGWQLTAADMTEIDRLVA